MVKYSRQKPDNDVFKRALHMNDSVTRNKMSQDRAYFLKNIVVQDSNLAKHVYLKPTIWVWCFNIATLGPKAYIFLFGKGAVLIMKRKRAPLKIQSIIKRKAYLYMSKVSISIFFGIKY